MLKSGVQKGGLLHTISMHTGLLQAPEVLHPDNPIVTYESDVYS